MSIETRNDLSKALRSIWSHGKVQPCTSQMLTFQQVVVKVRNSCCISNVLFPALVAQLFILWCTTLNKVLCSTWQGRPSESQLCSLSFSVDWERLNIFEDTLLTTRCSLFIVHLSSKSSELSTWQSHRSNSTALLKAGTDGYWKQFKLSLLSAELFAQQHGLPFFIYDGSAKHFRALNQPPHMAKKDGILKLFELGYEFVFFTDFDMVFTPGSMCFPILPIVQPGVELLLQQEKDTNTGALIFHNSPWSVKFLLDWSSFAASGCCNQHPFDQIAFGHVLFSYFRLYNRKLRSPRNNYTQPRTVFHLLRGRPAEVGFQEQPALASCWLEGLKKPFWRGCSLNRQTLLYHTKHVNWVKAHASLIQVVKQQLQMALHRNESCLEGNTFLQRRRENSLHL